MLLHRLKVSGLLSFGPKGVDLPMEPLNVLIGPNGSGKSNFLEAMALLQAAPRDISEPISRMGGVREWLWKGPEAPESFTLEASIGYPPGGLIRHSMTLADRNGRPDVIDERLEPSEAHANERAALSYYRPPQDEKAAMEFSKANAEAARLDAKRKRRVGEWSTPPMIARYRPGAIDFASEAQPDQSLLSWAATTDYPALWHLKEQYRRIRLYRNWSFGPSAEFRRSQSAHDRADFLDDQGTNLALVLSHFQGQNKRQLVTALQKLYHGIVDITCPVTGGTVGLYLEETRQPHDSGPRACPTGHSATCACSPFYCIPSLRLWSSSRSPELGLHPDLLPKLTDLLRAASERTQLIVTTHSDVFVDALTEVPASIVVCEKHDGQTQMRRLDKDDLANWLEDYRLGEL